MLIKIRQTHKGKSRHKAEWGLSEKRRRLRERHGQNTLCAYIDNHSNTNDFVESIGLNYKHSCIFGTESLDFDPLSSHVTVMV